MNKFERQYNQHKQPLFEKFCPIDFANIYETVISSPTIEAIGTEINTHILHMLNNPSLKYIRSIDAKCYALFANQNRKLRDFGISTHHAILGENLSSGISSQILNSAQEVHNLNYRLINQNPCVSKTFEIHGFATQIPSEIILPSTITRKKESDIWYNGESIPKTSENSIPEIHSYKGLIFEYIALLSFSLIKSPHRLYRQFAPLIKRYDDTYTQGFRVDGYVDNTAIECKWDLFQDNFWKIEKDKYRFSNQNINMLGISYRPITGCDLEFQTYSDMIEPLLASHYPGLSLVVSSLEKLLDSIESTNCLPINHKILCQAFYNILDQASLMQEKEKIDFITEHLHQILEIFQNKHQLMEYVEANEFNFPQISNESSLRYKSNMYIAYTKPIREHADPEIAFKKLNTYRGVSFPNLELSYIQSLQPKPSINIKEFYTGNQRESVTFNQGQANISELHSIVHNLNNQQASIAELYTLFNFVRSATHRTFTKSSHVHAIF
jgi:hypothetical protein